MKTKTFLFALLTIILTSCVTQKKCLQKFPPATQRDSIYIEKVKEIPVYLPGDTVNVSTPVNCPDQDLVNMETTKLKQIIKILNGKLVASTTIKPDTVKVTVTEIHEKVKEVKVPEPVKYIPKIYKDALWICIILFSGGFAWFGYKVYKFIKE